MGFVGRSNCYKKRATKRRLNLNKCYEVLNMKNEKQQGIWIFEDADEFLKVIEELQSAYNGVGQNDQ